MHSESTFVYAVTGAASFTSHLSHCLVSAMQPPPPRSSVSPLRLTLFVRPLPPDCHPINFRRASLHIRPSLSLASRRIPFPSNSSQQLLCVVCLETGGGERGEGIAHCCTGKDEDAKRGERGVSGSGRGDERGEEKRGEEGN